MDAKDGENGAGAAMAPAFRFSGSPTSSHPGRAPVLTFSRVTFRYSPELHPAVSALDLELHAGEIMAVVGGNGSGKTTLARLTNGLLLPGEGEVRVSGLLTSEPEHSWEIRSRVGLLFQNPDDQIVGASVEDDVAFGLENLGVPRDQMRQVVAESIARVGLSGEESREPHLLSGGQRQRLALASVLALQPSVLVLDEPTSMLDTAGREEILGYVGQLAQEGMAVLLITQHMDETLRAHSLVYLERGQAAYRGSPRDFFTTGRYEGTPLGGPRALELAQSLPPGLVSGAPLDEDRLVEALAGRLSSGALGEESSHTSPATPRESSRADRGLEQVEPEAEIALHGVGLVYDSGLPFARRALQDVELELPGGKITAVLGPTAAGKSSLLQVMAGLLPPSSGVVSFRGRARPAPGQVGMVFQRPEIQLFAGSVFEDVATAPRQQGLTAHRVEERVTEALRLVGLDAASFGPRSPHRLSLGEQRRVALAGILSLDPAILILDEPGAGLDPSGRRRLLGDLAAWAGAGRTLVFTSHDLDEVAEVADLVLFLESGRMAAFGGRELLADERLLAGLGLAPPLAARVAARLGLPLGQRPVRARDLARLFSVGAVGGGSKETAE